MKLTQQELEAALRAVAGKIMLDKGVFIEGSGDRWFVGSEGSDFAEPDHLDVKGEWGRKMNYYFPTPLAALEHAKKYGYLPKMAA